MGFVSQFDPCGILRSSQVIPRLPPRPKSLKGSLIPLIAHSSTILSALSFEISKPDKHAVLKQAVRMIISISAKVVGVESQEAREQLIVSDSLDLLKLFDLTWGNV